MKLVVNNKHSSNLKIWSVEMPNATYSNRWQQVREIANRKFYKQNYNKEKLIIWQKILNQN